MTSEETTKFMRNFYFNFLPSADREDVEEMFADYFTKLDVDDARLVASYSMDGFTYLAGLTRLGEDNLIEAINDITSRFEGPVMVAFNIALALQAFKASDDTTKQYMERVKIIQQEIIEKDREESR